MSLLDGLDHVLNNNPLRNAQVEGMVRRLWVEGGRPQYGRVLVLGGQNRIVVKEVRRRFKPRTLVCIENDPDLLKEARKTAGKMGMMRGDLDRLPFVKGSFHAVVALSTFQRTPDWQFALEEVSRVLRPGGLLMFETMGEDMWWTLDMPEWLNTVLGWEPKVDDKRFLARGSFLEELPRHGLRLTVERNFLMEGWIEGLAIREA